MGRKLYVGNLSYDLTEEQLREFFAQAGAVDTVSMITEKFSGKPKGFGFVEMATDEDAKKAIEQLNGQTLANRQIVVNEARPMQKRTGGYNAFGGGNRERRDRY
ncbi:MAG: RNA-binding protein [Planctomycetes bacterium]|nr:RNA-binding protein [Planctomycetota bacterium]